MKTKLNTFNTIFFKILICIFITNTSGCNQRVEVDLITNLMRFDSQKNSDDTLLRVYAVIPNQGCEGCISEAENFVITHASLSESNVTYIFTKIQSLKVLKYKLGSKIYSLPNVKIDTANIIVFPKDENNIYPMFIYTQANQINKIEYQSPNQNGLINLKSYLNSRHINK